jgi:FKBP-type peptidyl-prolyl cis-trans isomerase FklB
MRASTVLLLSALSFGALPMAVSSTAAQAAAYDLTAQSNQKYLKDNAAKPGVIKLPDGLQYRVLKTGHGASPKSGEDVVTVTYKGWMINGKVFDQTPPGQTAQFPAGHLIPGWVEALQRMKEGDSWELTIPANLAYGARGAGNDIPPNQTLVFDMELIKVTPAGP